MILIWATIIFLNAFLLFWLEPLAAKNLLPYFGGGASVWNSCMMFYQIVLLAGYAYAAFLLRLKSFHQIFVHVLLLFASCFLAPTESFQPHWIEIHPVWGSLVSLTISIGLPFFLISSQGPLLQGWFGRSGHSASKDPYFLFAASNSGSFLALLLFPFLFEATLDLNHQFEAWGINYLILCFLVFCVAILIRNSLGSNQKLSSTTEAEESNSVPRWIFLSFFPSGLLLAVTSYISTDVGSIPLLWVLPLALYLLSFVIAFSKGDKLKHFAKAATSYRLFGSTLFSWFLPTFVLAVSLWVAVSFKANAFLAVIFHMTLFFLIATSFHIKLANSRPSSAKLGEFYLWIGLGGALGGVINTLIVPLILTRLHEYPVFLAGVIVFRSMDHLSFNIRDFVIPISIGAALSFFATDLAGLLPDTLDPRLILVAPGIYLIWTWRRAIQLALGVIMLLWSSTYFPTSIGNPVTVERSYYGIHRVYRDQNDRTWLEHGNTIHGGQASEREGLIPLTYYHPDGPIGDIFVRHRSDFKTMSVGIIGLGTGAMAWYQQPNESWRFFEIDPVVANLARDARYFRFLEGIEPDIVIGDGRTHVAKEPDKHYDMLVVDAFGSDSIPIHLITKQAMETYSSKLKDDGNILVHFSNRYLDLEQVLTNVAQSSGFNVLTKTDGVSSDARAAGRYISRWMLVTRQVPTQLPHLTDLGWKPQYKSNEKVFTDQYSSIVYLIRNLKK